MPQATEQSADLAPIIFMGIWAFFFLLSLVATATMTVSVYWGRQGLVSKVPMTRHSRVAFVFTVGLMIGMIVAGVTGFGYVNVIGPAFFASVVWVSICGVMDRRAYDRAQREKA